MILRTRAAYFFDEPKLMDVNLYTTLGVHRRFAQFIEQDR